MKVLGQGHHWVWDPSQLRAKRGGIAINCDRVIIVHANFRIIYKLLKEKYAFDKVDYNWIEALRDKIKKRKNLPEGKMSMSIG